MNLEQRLGLELTALRRAVWFHEGNSKFRKYIVSVLVLTWAVITVGVAFGEAVTTPVYGTLTALIWMIVGRVWSSEAEELLGET